MTPKRGSDTRSGRADATGKAGRSPAPRPGSSGSWSGFVAIVLSVAAVAFLAAVVVWAVRRDRGYPQASPDEVLKSAITMIKNGEAEKVSTLIYAPSPEFRAVLNRFGDLLGSLQDLGLAVAKRFPNDIQRIRADALKKATTSTGSAAAIQAMAARPGGALGAVRGGAAGRGGQPPDPRGLEDFAMTVFADPFGWIDANADRLTAVPINDEQAAVLVDGKPVPPIGLTMRYAENKWQIELPLSLPGVSQFLPQTRHEYSILGSLLKVLAAAIDELADDVRSGKISRTNQLAEKAGEKAFGPAAMVFIVYGKEMDVRSRRERAMSDYRKRQSAWLPTREGLKTTLGPVLWGRVIEAVDKLAIEEMDRLVRQDSLRTSREAPRAVPAFGPMNDAVFEATMEGWIQSAIAGLGPSAGGVGAVAGVGGKGEPLRFRFEQPGTPAQVEAVLKAIAEAGKRKR